MAKYFTEEVYRRGAPRSAVSRVTGYGVYPGQYGMLVLSQLPIDSDRSRTFQRFLWKQMPNALRPIDRSTGQPYYSDEAWDQFRLSSKSHWDVWIRWSDRELHLLASHPTPPVFDGPEDRNGRRNHDEIRFWADYIDPARSGYIRDDRGGEGGLSSEARFVIVGDLNADPEDGQSYALAIRQLLDHPRVARFAPPKSRGGVQASREQAGGNLKHAGDPAHDTGDFPDREPGNLRADYVLPSANLEIVDSGVFWPERGEPGFEASQASDHHLVWVDIRWIDHYPR